MGIGDRIRIQLVKFARQTNLDGRQSGSANDVYNLWAEIENVSGGRDSLNSQVQLDSTKRFIIRFRFDRNPDCDWKVRYEGKDWTVSQILKVDEKQFYWRLTATSKANV